ncbi:MAG: hypothetical protein ACKE51_01025 [Methylococcaceae bacterium]
MNKKLILLVIGIIALLAFQAKFIMPMVYDVATSDIFLETSGDERNNLSSNNAMTDIAYTQCNAHIANELLSEYSLTFTDSPINAFSLGNYRYVINADFEISPTDAASFNKRYVCRIKYDNGDDKSGLSDLENWSIEGLSGLDNI